MRKLLDFLNHSNGYGWFLLGCLVVFGQCMAWRWANDPA